MVKTISNDNDLKTSACAAGAGLGAILLVESLLHGLVERGLITVNEAIDIVATAEDVASNMRDDDLKPCSDHDRALQMLTSIGVSLEIDAA